MTEQEKNIIKNEIMDALLYGSKTIDQLTLSSDISDADLFEISGGRAITYSTLKAAIAASITNGGGSGSGHTHANKESLDQIATDSDGYIHLTYPKRVLNEATKEYETIITTEKVKAGYADKAGDLTEDSPVLKLINTIGSQFVPTYLDGSAYVETTWAEIVAGTRTLAAIKSKHGFFSDSFISARGANSAGGGSTGGAYYLYELIDTAISNPSSGQALVYNGSKWVNSTVEQNEYILPAASASTLGGVKVGATLAMASGVLDQKAGIVSEGVYPKVTVDTFGRVTAGELLAASDIPNLPWSKITSGTPTTIAGYGITDTYTKTDADNRFVQQSLFDSMFAKESDGNGGFRIKAKYGLYSDEFISARGVNPDGGGSGGGGVYYLHELLDAAISNPASGQALVYNGTKWVNQAIQTGLDEAALASYLTTHSYATQSWVESKGYLTAHQSLANYVTLNTPQNITGAKTFSANVTFQQPVNTYGFRLRFLENAEFKGGFIGYDGANNIFSFGVHEAYDTNPSNDFNAISILRSNAYVGIGTLSPTQKLHVNGNALASQFIKSGGTASQFLMADGSVATKHVLTTANNLGWVGTQGQIPTIDTLAFWNGRYNATNSNLQYCDRGRFGTMAVANAADYLARSGGSMTNTNVVTNLNADLLDGYQETAYFRSNIGSIALADIMTKLPGNRSGSYQITQTGWNGSAVVLYAGGSNSGLAFYRPGGSNSIPKILVAVDSTSTWTDKGTIVTTAEGNAPSATKLQTARTLWGQSFNGTANVSGDMSGVGNITASGQILLSSANTTHVHALNSSLASNSYAQFAVGKADSTYNRANLTYWHVADGSASNYIGLGLYGADKILNILGSGNVGIGTTTPTHKLDVAGDIRSNTMFIRDTYGGSSWYNGYGAYNTAIINNSSQTPLMVAYRAGQTPSVTGANRLFSLELLNTGTNLWFNFGGVNKFKMLNSGQFEASSIKIGSITLSYDAANGGLHVSGGGLYADSYITARGANTSGSGSAGGGLIQQVYGSSSLGGAFSDTTLTDTFNAYTINKIRTDLINADSALSGRIASLEGGAAVNVTTTGSGNAITAISKSGTTITATKGATFLTAHQSLANYVPWSKQSVATVNGTNHNPQFFNIENENLIANYKNYWSVINFGSYSGNNFRSQIAMPYQDSITDTDMFIRTANGSNWRAWRRVLHDGNYASILDSRYYTESEINTKLGNYVTLNTTQTITGLKTFSAAGTTAIFNSTSTTATNVVLKTNGTQRSSIGWYNNFVFISNEPGYTGASTDKYHRLGITDAGVPQFWTNRDGSKYTLLHEGNYSSVLDSRYYTESEINAKLTNGSVTKVGTATVGSTAKGIYLNGGTPTALSATVGAANRPVYMNAGTITAGTYTFGNGSGNAPISNGTLCTNLNADLLDGLHNGALTARYLNLAAFVTNCNAMPTHNGIFSWSGTNSANPATYGVLLQWSSVDNPTPGTDQHWITQLASATSNRLFYRTRINTGAWSGWSAVAFTSDNVASATKLQTARTLWGQSFNGTANVDGALTVHHTGACGVYISGGGESSYSCQASGGLRWVSGAYPDRYFIWDSSGNGNERLTILNNGSVGIGTTSPSAKLDVIGVIHSTAGIWSNGYVSARGQNTASDARLKTIMQTMLLDTKSIAAAPSVLFSWKDDGREDVGSIAQYWQRIDRHLVSHRPDGYLGLDYGKAALLSVISVAKQTLNHEARIKALEKENARLKEQIKSLT